MDNQYQEASLALMRFVGVRVPFISATEKVMSVETDGENWRILLSVEINDLHRYWHKTVKTGFRLVEVDSAGKVNSVRILDKSDSPRVVTSVREYETPEGHKTREDHLTTCYRPGNDSRVGSRDGWIRELEGYYLSDPVFPGELAWSPTL